MTLARSSLALTLGVTLTLAAGCAQSRYVEGKNTCVAQQTCPPDVDTGSGTVYYLTCRDRARGESHRVAVSRETYDATRVGDDC